MGAQTKYSTTVSGANYGTQLTSGVVKVWVSVQLDKADIADTTLEHLCVSEFCYLRGMIIGGEVAEASSIARVKRGWKRLTTRKLSLHLKSKI